MASPRDKTHVFNAPTPPPPPTHSQHQKTRFDHLDGSLEAIREALARPRDTYFATVAVEDSPVLTGHLESAEQTIFEATLLEHGLRDAQGDFATPSGGTLPVQICKPRQALETLDSDGTHGLSWRW